MAEINVRVLSEEDWQEYRSVRLAALEDSPTAFVNTLEEESRYDEQFWRDRMLRAHRLVAESEQTRLGIVCLGSFNEDPEIGDLFGLWVAPEARQTGVSWQLVQAVADQAVRDGRTKLYYFVGTENGRAIAFASNFGFRLTSHRRTARVRNEESGDQEIAMVLSLATDPGAVPNPTRPRATSKPGPLA